MDIREENKLLIRKYIDGQCTPLELATLKRLMAAQDLSDIFSEVMDEVASLAPQTITIPDTDAALMRFHQRLSADETAEAKIIQLNAARQKPRYRKYLAYAASILVICAVSIYFLMPHPAKNTTADLVYQHFNNPKGKRSKILLPDGSFVYLGAGSALSFSNKFMAATREVNLEGEAFFEVTKNPAKPFIIHTGNVNTKVLGTSFKVDAFAGKPVSVLVNTGKVRVDRKVKNKLYPIAVLLPGQFVSWDEQEQLKKTGTIATSDLADWKNGKLVFRQASLSDVTEALERWYNVDIHIPNKALSDRMIRVNLTINIPLNRIMKILSVAGSFKYKINNNTVTIF